MALTNHYTTRERNLIDQLQRDTEAWLRAVRDGGAWDRLPNENNPQFFPVAMRASMAVQAKMRGTIGARYLASIDAYRDISAAIPILIYSLSPVFGGRPRTEYAYDIHCGRTLRATTIGLDKVAGVALAQIEKRLMEAGEFDLADLYAPRRAHDIVRSVRVKQPKAMLALLRCDEILVTATVQLIAMAAELRDSETLREVHLKSVAAAYVKAIHRKLRNFCQSVDMTPVAPELLSETINSVRAVLAETAALAQIEAMPDPIDRAA